MSRNIRISLNDDINKVKTHAQKIADSHLGQETKIQLQIDSMKLAKVRATEEWMLFDFFITGISSIEIY